MPTPRFLIVFLIAAATATIASAPHHHPHDENGGKINSADDGCRVPVTLVAWLAKGADPEAFARRNGYRAVGPVANLEGVYEFAVACADGSEFGGDHAAAAENFEAALARKRDVDPEILKQVVQKKKKHSTRALWEREEAINNLPMYGRDQENIASATGYAPKWHLMDEPSNAASVHVLGAWARGRFGSGIKVAITDDGFDLGHKDISPGCDRSLSVNYCSGDKTDPSPRDNEAHGTCASAVAAARGFNLPPGSAECGHGIAPLANIVGVRLIAEPVSDADEARGLTHGQTSGISIYSCSWGPSDDGQTLDGPGDIAREAIERSGATYVWAAGNGRENGDSCAYDGYASNPHTIAVTAATYLGNQAWYSESCPAAFVSAPSSGDGRGVTTADVTGRKGYTTGNCNSNFGGTSAAAPVVAGVVALVLETEPALKRHDVARILAATARRIDESNPSWQLNSAGVWHSDAYGFGVADADAAVALAENWLDNFPNRESPPTEKFVFSGASGNFPIAIPDRDSSRRKISSGIFVGDGRQNFVAEGVVARVSVKVREANQAFF